MEPLVDPPALAITRRRAVVYVDAANLYRMKLKDKAGRRWLDLEAFFDKAYPNLDIVKIHFFAAKNVVTATAERQRIYLEVLESDAQPRVQVHMGHFSRGSWTSYPEVLTQPCCDVHPVGGPIRCCGPHTVYFKRTVEKCTDVNIATRLVADAGLGLFEVAIVVSNDGDLASPIKLVRDELHLLVRVFDPGRTRSEGLAAVAGASDYPMPNSLIESSQFPDVVSTTDGRSWHMPPEWAIDQPRTPSDAAWRSYPRVSAKNAPSNE
jgi:hypothetical protein